ncbi:MAG: ribbon-helix-helix domain-containing protein [Deltaproteobacteria bacterium]|nr:ribbon-helix-helix domain-containing protein [Deltaproteobacteria bacterium]
MGGKKQKATGFFLYPETHQKLSILSKKTRISKAAFVREALNDLFNKYDRILNDIDPDGIILRDSGID